MKLISSLILCCFIAVVSLFGHNHGSYNHDSDAVANNKDWMSQLSDSTPISLVSIPGTHDTLSLRNVWDVGQTQSMSLIKQLNSGIRAIDIRVKVEDGKLEIYHGDYKQYYNLTTHVMEVLVKFLKNHPSEFVIMRLNIEGSSKDSSTTFTKLFNAIYKKYKPYFYTRIHSGLPNVSGARGKIVLLQNFNTDPRKLYGYSYPKLDIQDRYTISTNWDLHNKWNSVKNFMEKVSRDKSDKLHINFLSASGGSFPYFVASGHTSHGTGASRLATGFFFYDDLS